MRRLIPVFLTAGSVAWLGAVLLAPLAHRHVPAAAAAVSRAGAIVCHQQPARSFHARGVPLPVCARCTGLYLAGAIGACAAWATAAVMPRRMGALLAVAALPTLLTVLLEWTGLGHPSNIVRAVAALPLGAAAGWVFVRMLRAEDGL